MKKGLRVCLLQNPYNLAFWIYMNLKTFWCHLQFITSCNDLVKFYEKNELHTYDKYLISFDSCKSILT